MFLDFVSKTRVLVRIQPDHFVSITIGLSLKEIFLPKPHCAKEEILTIRASRGDVYGLYVVLVLVVMEPKNIAYYYYTDPTAALPMLFVSLSQF